MGRLQLPSHLPYCEAQRDCKVFLWSTSRWCWLCVQKSITTGFSPQIFKAWSFTLWRLLLVRLANSVPSIQLYTIYHKPRPLVYLCAMTLPPCLSVCNDPTPLSICVQWPCLLVQLFAVTPYLSGKLYNKHTELPRCWGFPYQKAQSTWSQHVCPFVSVFVFSFSCDPSQVKFLESVKGHNNKPFKNVEERAPWSDWQYCSAPWWWGFGVQCRGCSMALWCWLLQHWKQEPWTDGRFILNEELEASGIHRTLAVS